MKSEPNRFSIDDLRAAPQGIAPWDGARNYQARNLLRDRVKAGDGVLFYHSGTATPGIAGIAEVVRAGYPDHTAWEANGEQFDPKSTPARPVWYMVDVRFVEKFRQLIPLAKLKTTPGLEGMEVARRGSRLSVQPVSRSEWEIVRRIARNMDPG
ncbi:MAG TPA: EVE domain-containing protein [candidate division Zixibacteria bacterium]|nr:EVE domain-containing protein [candidate division Zixibacteria bacterium]HPI33220.1 EVE domain-containing protein [candidate division Zixibacteria bacterium]HQL24019.1 EVE domain-containing protein [candidate division Zixibacteria bacterium]